MTARTVQLAAKRSGLTEDQQLDLDEELASIARYPNITEDKRDVCKRNAVMFAQLRAMQPEREPERPMAKVLPFKPRHA